MDEQKPSPRIKKSSNPELQQLYDAREKAIKDNDKEATRLANYNITKFKATERRKKVVKRREEYRAF